LLGDVGCALLFRDCAAAAAQDVLLDFPSRRFGQFRNKGHALRRFEVRKVRARKFD
jgi:hypothetical protein